MKFVVFYNFRKLNYNNFCPKKHPHFFPKTPQFLFHPILQIVTFLTKKWTNCHFDFYHKKMKSRAAHVEENRIIGQEINNSETENPVFRCGSRSFRVSKLVRNTLLVGLLGGNSRSFTLIFMAAFSVLLFCFDRKIVKHSVIQHVGYSCDIWRYTRAQSNLLRNLPKFWRFKKRICHKKG